MYREDAQKIIKNVQYDSDFSVIQLAEKIHPNNAQCAITQTHKMQNIFKTYATDLLVSVLPNTKENKYVVPPKPVRKITETQRHRLPESDSKFRNATIVAWKMCDTLPPEVRTAEQYDNAFFQRIADCFSDENVVAVWQSVIRKSLASLPSYARGMDDFKIENGILQKYVGKGYDVKIPDGITSIGACAFFDCSNLTSITIPSSVTCIGNRAFNGCSGLTDITIPDSITYIGDKAFFYCSSLTDITISSSVTYIGICSFRGCYNLKKVTLPQRFQSDIQSIFDNTNNIEFAYTD